MSTPAKKPAAKPAKAAAATAPVAEAPKEAAPPAVEPISAATEEVAAEPVKETKQKQPKTSDQIAADRAKLANAHIPAARVRNQLDDLMLNFRIEEAVKPRKADTAPYERAETIIKTKQVQETVMTDGKKERKTRDATDEELAEAKKVVDGTAQSTIAAKQIEIKVYNHERVRFGTNGIPHLAAACTAITVELVTQAIKKALASEKKRKLLKPAHVNSEDAELMACYPLVSRLPSWRAQDVVVKKKREAELIAAVEDRVRKQVTAEIKAANTLAPKEGKAAPKDAKVAKEVVEEVPAEDDGKHPFAHYIFFIIRNIALSNVNPEWHTVRVSVELRNYLSDLIVEFIQRVGSQVYRSNKYADNKTVDIDTIDHVIESFLTDGHERHEELKLTFEQQPDQVELKKARDEAKTKGAKVVKNDVRHVTTMVARRVVTYPTSSLEAFRAMMKRHTQAHE